MRKTVVLGVMAVVAVVAAPAFAQTAPTGTWSPTKIPTGSNPHQWGGGCSDGTYLYYWGSNYDQWAQWKYDFVANSWTTGVRMNINSPWGTYLSTGCNYGGPTGANYAFGDNSWSYGSIRKFNLV